jgi:hypothetical protein
MGTSPHHKNFLSIDGGDRAKPLGGTKCGRDSSTADKKSITHLEGQHVARAAQMQVSGLEEIK